MDPERRTPVLMKRFYTAIVRRRRLVLAVFALAAVLSVFAVRQVKVDYDINDYLPPESPSTTAIEVMNGAFTGGIPNMRVMVRDVTVPQALDSLALYTNAGFKASMTVTLCMLALALAELVYTLVVFITGHPVEGWTTTMFVITVGFSGLFAVLTIVVKYLSLLVDLVFKQQKYLVESIEKLQK